MSLQREKKVTYGCLRTHNARTDNGGTQDTPILNKSPAHENVLYRGSRPSLNKDSFEVRVTRYRRQGDPATTFGAGRITYVFLECEQSPHCQNSSQCTDTELSLSPTTRSTVDT